MFTIRPIESEASKEICGTAVDNTMFEVSLCDTSNLPPGECRQTPAHSVLPAQFFLYAGRIQNLTVYDDDVWIVTFPKCGTTWTQEMVWLIDHDLDYKTASEVNLLNRSIFLEICALKSTFPEDTVTAVEQMKRPRHIKSHLPMALLPRQLWTVKPKIVYCARNTKDVAVSFYHHYCHLHGFTGTKECFLNAFLDEQVIYQPQIPHTLDFWNIRNQENVLFIHFEQMKRNMRDVLQKVCKFFNKTYTEDQLKELQHHLSFDVMKQNKSANNETLVEFFKSVYNRKDDDFAFMRKGEVGAYREELAPSIISRLTEYTERYLQNSDFKFYD